MVSTLCRILRVATIRNRSLAIYRGNRRLCFDVFESYENYGNCMLTRSSTERTITSVTQLAVFEPDFRRVSMLTLDISSQMIVTNHGAIADRTLVAIAAFKYRGTRPLTEVSPGKISEQLDARAVLTYLSLLICGKNCSNHDANLRVQD